MLVSSISSSKNTVYTRLSFSVKYLITYRYIIILFQYPVPIDDTTYWCKTTRAPELVQSLQIIAVSLTASRKIAYNAYL